MTAPAKLAGRWPWYKDISEGCTPDTGPLMRRYILLRTPVGNLYVHHFIRSDFDRAFHDHPWWFVTLILRGGYIEHTPQGNFRRRAGSILFRPARWLHWVEVGKPAWTLLFVGPKSREWGFLTRTGWVSWRKFIGAGCGEGEK